MQNMKKEFEDNSQLTDDHSSRSFNIEGQTPEVATYMSQLEEIKETLSDLYNSIVNLQCILTKKSSEKDIIN